ncbi:phosphotransferase [Arthrobacter sp. H5]|uniref:phosphotransferase n=1 Tax=Arthrobacter sp. H5 TaxID=1267973 RepID=UPI00048A36DE|nr:phosphotransferase [Arthrobacter sp. H5]
MNMVRTQLDPSLPGLDALFDEDRLSGLVGRPVSAAHLRWKPGVSAVTRLHDDDDDGGVRWAATHSEHASRKLEKTFRRAHTQGLEVERIELGQDDLDGGTLVSGPISLDPRLYRALQPFRRDGMRDIFASPAVRVLNYNPFRRVVFAVDGSVVCRAGASRSVDHSLLERLAASGIPVLTPVHPPNLPWGAHLQYFPWFGSGDLSTVPQTPEAGPSSYAAGEALALLHAQPPASGTHTWRAPAGRLASLIRENSHLLPESAERLQRVHTGLEPLLRRPGLAALVHGDFSADQVLTAGNEVRLTDFDRCTYGAAASDLGSFAAVEILHAMPLPPSTDVLGLPRTAALLDGYSSGRFAVNTSEVLGWTVFHLLNRLREPFRACSATWRSDMTARLDLIEEILW